MINSPVETWETMPMFRSLLPSDASITTSVSGSHVRPSSVDLTIRPSTDLGLLAGDPRLTLDPTEVELAFEVPLEFLLDPINESWSERDIDGIPVPIVEFHYGGQRIWGATASMIVTFRTFLDI